MKSMCRHCRRRPVNRPRGLCWKCFYTPGLRDRYGWRDVGGSSARGRGLANADPPPPPEPTPHLQGTEAKIRVLAERCAAGYGLWHSQDNTGEG